MSCRQQYTCKICSTTIQKTEVSQHVEERHVGPRLIDGLVEIGCSQCSFQVPIANLTALLDHFTLLGHSFQQLHYEWSIFVKSEELRLTKIARLSLDILKNQAHQQELGTGTLATPRLSSNFPRNEAIWRNQPQKRARSKLPIHQSSAESGKNENLQGANDSRKASELGSSVPQSISPPSSFVPKFNPRFLISQQQGAKTTVRNPVPPKYTTDAGVKAEPPVEDEANNFGSRFEENNDEQCQNFTEFEDDFDEELAHLSIAGELPTSQSSEKRSAQSPHSMNLSLQPTAITGSISEDEQNSGSNGRNDSSDSKTLSPEPKKKRKFARKAKHKTSQEVTKKQRKHKEEKQPKQPKEPRTPKPVKERPPPAERSKTPVLMPLDEENVPQAAKEMAADKELNRVLTPRPVPIRKRHDVCAARVAKGGKPCTTLDCSLCDYKIHLCSATATRSAVHHTYFHANAELKPLKCSSCSYRTAILHQIREHKLFRLQGRKCGEGYENVQTPESIEKIRKLFLIVFPRGNWDVLAPPGSTRFGLKF